MSSYVNYSEMNTDHLNQTVRKVHVVAQEHPGAPVNFNHWSVYLEIEGESFVELIMDPGDDNDDYWGTLRFISRGYHYDILNAKR